MSVLRIPGSERFYSRNGARQKERERERERERETFL